MWDQISRRVTSAVMGESSNHVWRSGRRAGVKHGDEAERFEGADLLRGEAEVVAARVSADDHARDRDAGDARDDVHVARADGAVVSVAVVEVVGVCAGAAGGVVRAEVHRAGDDVAGDPVAADAHGADGAVAIHRLRQVVVSAEELRPLDAPADGDAF
jgi:hypothetical protein